MRYLVIFTICILFSCSKDKTVAGPSGVIFVNKTVKSIIDNKCASCHVTGGSGVSSWYYNYSDYWNTVYSSGDAICSSISSNRMPQGNTLSQSEKDSFIKWKNLGYPN